MPLVSSPLENGTKEDQRQSKANPLLVCWSRAAPQIRSCPLDPPACHVTATNCSLCRSPLHSSRTAVSQMHWCKGKQRFRHPQVVGTLHPVPPVSLDSLSGGLHQRGDHRPGWKGSG